MRDYILRCWPHITLDYIANKFIKPKKIKLWLIKYAANWNAILMKQWIINQRKKTEKELMTYVFEGKMEKLTYKLKYYWKHLKKQKLQLTKQK